MNEKGTYDDPIHIGDNALLFEGANGEIRHKVNSENAPVDANTEGYAQSGYVVRDCTGYDFDEGDLTTDGTWQVDGLDLSSIVPAGAIAVDLEIKVEDDATSYLHIRRDATNTGNRILMTISVANIAVYQVARIAINSNRLLDYLASNVTFTSIGIAVVGWVRNL